MAERESNLLSTAEKRLLEARSTLRLGLEAEKGRIRDLVLREKSSADADILDQNGLETEETLLRLKLRQFNGNVDSVRNKTWTKIVKRQIEQLLQWERKACAEVTTF